MNKFKEQNTLYNGNQEQLNSKISIINELFHKMNLQGRSESNLKPLEIKLTSDCEEPPQPSQSIKAYQLNKTQSEFHKYLQRKQQQLQPQREIMISDNTFDDKEEDLLTDIRAIDSEADYEKQVPSVSRSKLQNSNQSKSFTQRTIPNQYLRNYTETPEINCNQKLCKLPKRDLAKLNKNKEIIEQAYSMFVEGNQNNQSHSPICKRPMNLHNNSTKGLMKPTKSVENLSKLQATIKKNYFRY